ncbi:hypothetical protein [Tanticharoenia sakaeratensis]|uniref:hypothetical protein n=1 Tax=Tanticharoenia sakaeratensis TaxID=444053 RepID=UPI00130D90BF|nr:hypothetical protein [Tanticharoenia sakaeratensis]
MAREQVGDEIEARNGMDGVGQRCGRSVIQGNGRIRGGIDPERAEMDGVLPSEGSNFSRRDGGNATEIRFLKSDFLSCEVRTCFGLDCAARRMLRHEIDGVSGFSLGAGEQDAEQGGDFRYGMHARTLDRGSSDLASRSASFRYNGAASVCAGRSGSAICLTAGRRVSGQAFAGGYCALKVLADGQVKANEPFPRLVFVFTERVSLVERCVG